MSNTFFPAIGCLGLTMGISILGSQFITTSNLQSAWTQLTQSMPLTTQQTAENIISWKFPSTEQGRRDLALATPWFNPDFLIEVSKISLNQDPIVFELPRADIMHYEVDILDSSGQFIRNIGTSEGPVEAANYLIFGPNTRNRSIAGTAKLNIDSGSAYLISRVRLFDMESNHFAYSLNKEIRLLRFEEIRWDSSGHKKEESEIDTLQAIPEKVRFLAYQEKLKAEKYSHQNNLGRKFDQTSVNDNGWGKNTESNPLDKVKAELEILGLDPESVLNEQDSDEQQKFRIRDPAYYSP